MKRITKQKSINPFFLPFKIITIVIFVVYLTNCSTPDEVSPEDVNFSEDKQAAFLKMGDKKNQDFLSRIESIQENHKSFSANFSLRIDRYSPKKEKFYADGRIYFSKESGKIKIQLMDNFFGLVFSEVWASPGSIQIKSSESDKIHSQPMGDLVIHDPSKNKDITIPFPVIYYSITGDYKKEFSDNPSFFSPDEGRVLVKKGKDEFTYFFDETRLTDLEWNSIAKNTKAIAKTGDAKSFPPTNLVTKILENNSEKETVLIVTKLRNVKMKAPPESVFSLP